MSDTKTVTRRIRPITIQCGAPGCGTKPHDAVLDQRDDGTQGVIAPAGWTFPENVEGKGDVFVGSCPYHSAK